MPPCGRHEENMVIEELQNKKDVKAALKRPY